MTFEDIVREAQALPVAQRKHLITLIVDSLTPTDHELGHSILELEGLGAAVWADMETQRYVDQMRNEWDDRA